MQVTPPPRRIVDILSAEKVIQGSHKEEEAEPEAEPEGEPEGEPSVDEHEYGFDSTSMQAYRQLAGPPEKIPPHRPFTQRN